MAAHRPHDWLGCDAEKVETPKSEVEQLPLPLPLVDSIKPPPSQGRSMTNDAFVRQPSLPEPKILLCTNQRTPFRRSLFPIVSAQWGIEINVTCRAPRTKDKIEKRSEYSSCSGFPPYPAVWSDRPGALGHLRKTQNVARPSDEACPSVSINGLFGMLMKATFGLRGGAISGRCPRRYSEHGSHPQPHTSSTTKTGSCQQQLWFSGRHRNFGDLIRHW